MGTTWCGIFTTDDEYGGRALKYRCHDFMNHNAYRRYEMRKVQSLTQDESLRARERHTISCIPLVTTYNPRNSYIAEVADRNWHLLQSKERLARIFRERPVITYRRSGEKSTRHNRQCQINRHKP